MSNISENYQQDKEQERDAGVPYSFATVVAVHPDGLQLVFPGETGTSPKRYKCNTTVRFEPGQRVYVAKDSGSYVVLFPIGSPGTGTVVSAEHAAQLDNTGTNYRNIQFRMKYTNVLEYRICQDGAPWHTIQNKQESTTNEDISKQ